MNSVLCYFINYLTINFLIQKPFFVFLQWRYFLLKKFKQQLNKMKQKLLQKNKPIVSVKKRLAILFVILITLTFLRKQILLNFHLVVYQVGLTYLVQVLILRQQQLQIFQLEVLQEEAV